jgi:phosphatidylserine/phosphatidylglycerophosphate/cardiolipin synthase-like enzyme
MIKAYFNRPQMPWSREQLLQDLEFASEKLAIASAWFTDMDIAQAWIRSPAMEKVAILSQADLDRPGSQQVLQELQTYVTQKNVRGYEAYVCVLGSHDFRQGIMHHKFVLVNRKIVWVGSYNFTWQAQKNYETILRIESPELAAIFWNEVRVMQTDEWEWVNEIIPGKFRCVSCDEVKYLMHRNPLSIQTTGGPYCVGCYPISP